MEEANPQLDRMWASRRVERLSNEQRSTGSTAHVDEIVQLCEGYSIVSEHASFIVLENDAEYKRWQIERRNATRIRRDEAAQQALRSQLDSLRQQAASQIGLAPTREVAATPAPGRRRLPLKLRRNSPRPRRLCPLVVRTSMCPTLEAGVPLIPSRLSLVVV